MQDTTTGTTADRHEQPLESVVALTGGAVALCGGLIAAGSTGPFPLPVSNPVAAILGCLIGLCGALFAGSGHHVRAWFGH